MIDNLQRDSNEPYGIALYDFSATHPDDLALKEGDIVQLVKKVNDDWLEGRIGNRQGIFPVNFIDIKISLAGLSDNVVTALYTFPGENSDDLSFEVSKIKAKQLNERFIMFLTFIIILLLLFLTLFCYFRRERKLQSYQGYRRIGYTVSITVEEDNFQ